MIDIATLDLVFYNIAHFNFNEEEVFSLLFEYWYPEDQSKYNSENEADLNSTIVS